MKIDFIIPLYNKKNYIGNCLKSILSQKTQSFNKIIVVNDGSTDGSEKIVEEYKKNYDCIDLINQKNSGSSVARNTGIEKSKAKFVIFLDADDQIHEKYLVAINLMLKKFPNSKIFSTKHCNIYKNKKIIENAKDKKIFKEKIKKIGNPILKYTTDFKIFCSSGICIDRNLILENKFPINVNVGEDIYTWLRIFNRDDLILYEEELIFIFKISENRSIEIFDETPFYLTKINEFNNYYNKYHYFFYFIVASIIHLFKINSQKIKDVSSFLSLIKSQSKIIYYILKISNNSFFYLTYKVLKKLKDNKEINQENLNNKNFYISSFCYFFSIPSMPIIILCFYLLKKYELSAEVLLISSLTIFVTSSISFYARPYTVLSNQLKNGIYFLNLRKLAITPLFLIIFFFSILMELNNFYSVTIGILLILYLWSSETKLIIYELIGSRKKMFKYLLEILFLQFLVIASIFFDDNFIKILTILSIIYFSSTGLRKLIKSKINRKISNILLKFKTENYYLMVFNSLLVSITNFLFRYLIIFFCDKNYAGILFFAFSLGSLPANLFSFVFSTSIIRQRKVPNLIIFSIIIYLLITIYIFYLDTTNYKNSFLFNYVDSTHLNLFYISMLGGSLMSLALFLKNRIFLLEKFLSKLLKYEFLYSFFVLLTIPIIYYSLSIEYFGYLFLINSIFGLIIFATLHKRTFLK